MKKWKELTRREKIKTVSKYFVNGLNMANLLIYELSPIWGWKLDSITKTIGVVAGAISVYLVAGKFFNSNIEEAKEEEKQINQ